jgi:aerobic C4-dicarboxylate transport protein
VLILGIDRFMSECRTLTNIAGNGVAAREKELDRGMLHAQLGMPQRVEDVEGERPALASLCRWKQRKAERSR